MPEDPATILAALRDRLITARTRPGGSTTTWTYPLDQVVLPDSGDGDPGAVRTALVSALAPGSTAPLSVTSASDPLLASQPGQPGTLTLTGTSAVLTGDAGTAVTLVFTVSPAVELTATWIAAPPAGWTLASAFPALTETPFDYLPVSDVKFAAATAIHIDPGFFFPLAAGLQYQASLAVRGDLTPAAGEPGQQGTYYTRVGGQIHLAADGRPSFSWTAAAPLGPLTITRAGQGPLTLQAGMPVLSCAPSASAVPAGQPAWPYDGPDLVITSLTIGGTVSIGSSPVACVLDLPTMLTDTLTLTATAMAVSAASTAAALADCGTGDVLGGLLPSALLALTGSSVTGYQVRFSPSGDGATATAIAIGLGPGTWDLVPALNLSITGLTLTGLVVRAPGYRASPVLSWGAAVGGRLTLGSGYAVRAVVPPNGPWYVELADENQQPTLAVLAGLTGLDGDQVLGVLPDSLVALGKNVTLSKVALLVDPVTKSLAEVAFTIGQIAPWPLLGGLLTLSDWTAELAIAKDLKGKWSTTGVLRGTVSLTGSGQTTSLSLDLPVPIGAGQLWTLALAPGSVVRLPSIGQVLALLGGDQAALPANVPAWGGLTLTGFTVSVDPAAATLKHVAFACEQASDWTIITGGLVIKDVAAALAFLPGTSPVQVAGQITGTLVLAGSPVDVLVSKRDFSGGWLLAAAYDNPVRVPGFSALDAWLDPSDSQTALAGVPLTAGFDVSEVFMDFAGDAGGAPASFGFTISAADAWTVLPNYLSLTSLAARLQLPYPVNSAGITGSVSGVITLAGVDVAVSAVKPAQGMPWKFSGTLLNGLHINLIDAADSITSKALALPGDAARYGLPAAISIVSASVQVVPDTGEFHFAGQADFDWTFSLGSAQLAVKSIAGTIDIPSKNDQLAATIAGTFDFAGMHTVLTLAIGGATAQTILTGVLTAAEAGSVQIGALTDGIGAQADNQKWEAVAPAGLAPAFSGIAAVYLNLTTSQFAIYGGITCGTGLAASGLVYLSAAEGKPWTYAVALALGPQFTFGALLPALAAADQHVRVASARLVVCDLADVTLGDLATATTTLLSQVAPNAPAPLAGLTGAAMRISTGAYFTAQLDFSPVSLFSRILQIGQEGGTASVWLEAVIDRADAANTTFSAGLPDIVIASTIKLTHTAGEKYLRLTYTPAKAGLLEISGQLQLTGIFDGAGYAFDAMLAIDDAGLTSTITQTGPDIDRPFGVPNIVLSKPSLVVNYVWAVPAGNGHPATPQTSSFELTGRALIGGAPSAGQPDGRVAFGARLVLLSGSPALFDITLDTDFSIAAFLTGIFTGSAATWNFIDVTFLAGTHIYYYDKNSDPSGTLKFPDGTAPKAGFNLDAKLKLTLVAEITLNGTLSVLPASGGTGYAQISASIGLTGPLDLVFVELAGSAQPPPGQPYTGSPVLTFASGASASFGLAAGINFLGSAFLAIEVQVAKGTDGGSVLTGHLTAARELYPFGTLGCGFTYTSHPGRAGEFAIDGWPDFEWAGDLIDLVAAVKKLADTSPSSPCGQLADFVVSNAYTSDFKVKPAVTVAGTNLVFGFSGTYSLTLTGAKAPFATLDLPAFNVAIASTTRWETLPDALKAGIANAAGDFAAALLKQPDKIALFLAMVVGPRAVSVALELACNELVDGAVAAAAAAALDAIATAGGALAAGAIAAAIAAITASIAKSGPPSPPPPPGKPATPHLVSVAYADNTVTGNWDAAYGAAGYSFELVAPGGSVVARKDVGLTVGAELSVDPAPLAAGTYTAAVQASRGSQTSDWAGLPLVKPAGPAVTLSYAEPALTASWQDSGADSYTAQFFDPSGQQFGGDVTAGPGAGKANAAVPDPVAGAYTAHVRGDKAGQFPGAFGPMASLNVLSASAPPAPAVTREGNVLTATWTAAPGMGYDLRLTDGSTVMATASAVPGAGTGVLTPAAPLVSGKAYTVALRASGGGLSPWTTTTFTAWDVPAPGPVALRCMDAEPGRIFASWGQANVTGAPAAVYRLELIDLAHPDQPAGDLAGLSGSRAFPARSDGQRPVDGAHYAVKVRGDVGGNLGPWATSDPLLIATLPPPSAITLTASGPRLSLTWTSPPVQAPWNGPVSFATVLRCGTTDVGSATIDGTNWTPVRNDQRTPQPGEDYSCAIVAWTPQYGSAEAGSQHVKILDQVQLSAVSYDAGAITATWSHSAFTAASYDLVVTPQAGGPLVHSSTGATSIRIQMPGNQPRGMYNVQVRPALPGSAGDWSAPLPVLVLDSVTDLAVSSDGALLLLNWTGATGAADYVVLVMNGQSIVEGTHLLPANPGDSPPTQMGWLQGNLVPGTTYTAVVKSELGGQTAEPGTRADFVMPAAAGDVTASYDGTEITVKWTAPAGQVTGYLVKMSLPDGTVAKSVQVPHSSQGQGQMTQISAADLEHGAVTYQVTVQAQIGALNSVPAAPFPCTLVDPPGGLAATVVNTVTGGQIVVTWQEPATPGARYLMRADNGNGTTVLQATSQRSPAVCAIPWSASEGTYTVRVSGSVDIAGPWSAPLPVTVARTYTCLALGSPPGGPCGDGGAGGGYGDVSYNVRAAGLRVFLPQGIPAGQTGWVAIPSATASPAAILVQLLAKLTAKGTLSPGDAFGILAARPSDVRVAPDNMPTGRTGLCLGTQFGGSCGNGGVEGNFGAVVLQIKFPEDYSPWQTPFKYGWVVTYPDEYTPLMFLLQLVRVLYDASVLSGTEPYDLFDQTMSVRLTAGAGGPNICLALGAPVGQATTTMGGHFGDVVTDVSAIELAAFQAGAGSGWASIERYDYSFEFAVLQLIALLTRRGVLGGSAPYDVLGVLGVLPRQVRGDS